MSGRNDQVERIVTDLIDFHCHLDLFPDHSSAILECEKMGVHTLTVTTTPKAWPRNRELTLKTRFVRAALGLHPQLIAERANEIQLWEKYLPQTRYVGEVGLDASLKFYKSFELQKQIFEKIVSLCSQVGGKILSVHSLRASKIVLDIIEKHRLTSNGHVILHWFTGNMSDARRAVDLGCYFSINAEMLNKHRDTVISLPIERLLIETDAPFSKYNGNQIMPWESALVISKLATIREIEQSVLSEILIANLYRLEAQ